MSAAELHRAWLELVDTDGPFLAVPPLKRVWPQGIPQLPAHARDLLTAARAEFERAWERLDRAAESEDEPAQESFQRARAEWVRTVLADVAGWRDMLVWGAGAAPQAAVASPNRQVRVAPTAALAGPDGIGALVTVVPVTDDLRAAGNDGWAASAVDRMEAMLRAAEIPIGIVTDGRWWALVCARPTVMAASGIVDVFTWGEEPRTRDAFLTLIHRRHLVGGAAEERLPKLFEESVAAAEEITEALGSQVRQAVELLVQAFSEADAEARRHGRPSPLPRDGHAVYQGCVTVMMQVVFLLFAEERGLLPQSHLFTGGYGISGELDALEHRERTDGPEALDATFLTWHRLLATARALSQGATFEDVRIPAYGGSLFDQGRFPFLCAIGEGGALALPIADRVMLHVLQSVQYARLSGGADARRICFRDIDVEQIGYIYEGLLGYTCTVVSDTAQLGLLGAPGAEPEIPLGVLESLAARHPVPAALAGAILAWVKEHQPAARSVTASALTRALTKPKPGEQDAAERQLRAIVDDEELRGRLLRWMPITRRDLRGRPTVFLDGGLVVTETPSRRNAGAHYTPRKLAEDVVLHALQPICYSPGPYQTPDESAWKLKSPEELLALKIADIAAGSGAFLVAAARYLAGRLVEAWIERDPADTHRTDLHRRAIRQVVASCLYGADINEMAVEMCKLSLWLVSLDRALPFSFVDDKIFHGNSLLGLTDLRQLKALHIDPTRPQQARFGDESVDEVVRKAVTIRESLASEVQENDPQRSASAKSRQLDRVREVTRQQTKVADAIVAAGLHVGGKPGRQLDEAYENLRQAVAQAFPGPGKEPDPGFLEKIIEVGLTPTVPTDYDRWKPLHWVLEVPDVIVTHGGFDAIIGNPPFVRGSDLTGAMGKNLRDWLVDQVAGGIRGNADLIAYFFLRVSQLTHNNCSMGLIATNSIAQGDTREVGLDQMLRGNWTITRSVQSNPWPSRRSASLEYSVAWMTSQPIAEELERIADGTRCKFISTLLEAEEAPKGIPRKLNANAKIAFNGCKVDRGFHVATDLARQWVEVSPLNREVLFPCLNGDDLNEYPDGSASHWAVDFNDRPENTSMAYKLPYRHTLEYVKPLREKNNRKARRERWWQYAENAPGMRAAVSGFGEILAIALTSKAVMPMRVPGNQILTNTIGIFATNSYADQAVLSSSIHQIWAIKYGSSMRADVRYTPSKVFETFPRPDHIDDLEVAGKALDTQRRGIMLRRNLGLTKLYNLVNDPGVVGDEDIGLVRRLHVEVDEAVVAAYGWSDVELGHGFHTYRQVRRWTVSPAARVELMDRLLEENLRRAKEEAKLSVPAGRKGRGRQKPVEQVEGQGEMSW